ncbi:MAG: RidA family protein [Desulfovibrio sp.]|jgi:2-iminobutanoate/2-iminopropanoate deaminase|nr:RidA family protein [Desulfovibrio sp.]
MNTLSVIDTDNAPGAVGPYSQAITVGGLIFTSGQLPMDPATKTMPEDIRKQAKNSLTNVKNILEAGGSSLAKVVKTTIFLADIKDFAAVNEVYATFFTKPFPARSCFAVKDLPLGAKVEIEAVAAE